MFALLKLLQSLIRSLHSDGTPGQVAAGIMLGACLGLTPLVSLHNLAVVAIILLINVSVPGAMLGWLLFVPLGFALDPVFHRIGHRLLLETPSLIPAWTALYNTPLAPFTGFNNTVVLGSIVGWLVLALPIFLAARAGIARYRATIGEQVRRSRFYQAVNGSRVYNVYTWFRAG